MTLLSNPINVGKMRGSHCCKLHQGDLASQVALQCNLQGILLKLLEKAKKGGETKTKGRKQDSRLGAKVKTKFYYYYY